MELGYSQLKARPLQPTIADRYWANPTRWNQQGFLVICALTLILANLIG